MGNRAPTDLNGLVSTFEVYAELFGAFHPKTLSQGLDVAVAYWLEGHSSRSRDLLERVIRDICAHHSDHWLLKSKADGVVRGLVIREREDRMACAIQRDVVDSMTRCLGADHPETQAARNRLFEMLMNAADETSPRS